MSLLALLPWCKWKSTNERKVARGNTVIAKSVTPERIDANKTIVDLDAEDLKTLDEYSVGLEQSKEWKRYVYPAFGVDFGFPDKS